MSKLCPSIWWLCLNEISDRDIEKEEVPGEKSEMKDFSYANLLETSLEEN